MNLGRTQQRIRWVTLGLLVGSAILLTILDSTGALGGVVGFVRDPLTYISTWTSARTDAVADVVAGPRNLDAALEEIARLQAENDTLRKQNEQLLEDAGEARKFPENLVIGRVIDVERNEAELFQRAVVQPAVDFNSVEIVFVVTEFNTINTDIFAEEP